MSPFTFDTTYYTIWKVSKIFLSDIVLLMALGHGSGVDQLRLEDRRLNSMLLFLILPTWRRTRLLILILAFGVFPMGNIFSVNSSRKHIDDHTLPSLSPSTKWCKVIPKKVNIFMWRLFLDRLPNRLNLSSRSLDIDSITCPVCNSLVESSVHTFFTCGMASTVWRRIHTWTGSSLSLFSSCDD
ncbi:RNA-directed DNA polymerase, eukaryota [Tanacetum coccineum]